MTVLNGIKGQIKCTSMFIFELYNCLYKGIILILAFLMWVLLIPDLGPYQNNVPMCNLSGLACLSTLICLLGLPVSFLWQYVPKPSQQFEAALWKR